MVLGAPGWLSWLSTHFSSGHDLMVCEFEPCVRLCADSSEPGACFGFCVSLSLSTPPLGVSFNTAPRPGQSCVWGAWVAQSVKRPTSAQVTISRFVSSSPASGSALTAGSLLWILCLPLSAPPLLVLCLSPSLKNKQT